MSLRDRTVALAEGRQLEELAGLLEKEGACPLRYPMLSILDAPDPEPVVSWLRDLCDDRFSHLILMTGEALNRLMGFAERAGLRDAALAALGKTRTVTRGPKPVRALRALGLEPHLIAEKPTTAGVIAALEHESLAGKTVGVTLYGEPNPALQQFLEQAGAAPRTVMPYVYAPASDAGKTLELIDALAAGRIDVIVFTSSPQVDRLCGVAAEHHREAELARGLERSCVAAVGPIVADTLRERGFRVDVCPEQGFVMKNLVQKLKARYA